MVGAADAADGEPADTPVEEIELDLRQALEAVINERLNALKGDLLKEMLKSEPVAKAVARLREAGGDGVIDARNRPGAVDPRKANGMKVARVAPSESSTTGEQAAEVQPARKRVGQNLGSEPGDAYIVAEVVSATQNQIESSTAEPVRRPSKSDAVSPTGAAAAPRRGSLLGATVDLGAVLGSLDDEIEEEPPEFVMLEESMWGVVLLIGTEPMGAAASGMLIILFLANLLVQFSFIYLLQTTGMTQQTYTPDQVEDYRQWRRNEAHSVDNYDTLSDRALAFRVCEGGVLNVASNIAEDFENIQGDTPLLSTA